MVSEVHRSKIAARSSCPCARTGNFSTLLPIVEQIAARSLCLCARTGTFSTLLPIVEQKCMKKLVFVCRHRDFQHPAPHCGAKMHPEARVRVHAQGLSAPCSPLWSKNAAVSVCLCAHTGAFSALLPIVEEGSSSQ